MINQQYKIYRESDFLIIKYNEIINQIPLDSITKVSKKIERVYGKLTYKMTINAGLKMDIYSHDEESLDNVFNIVKNHFAYK